MTVAGSSTTELVTNVVQHAALLSPTAAVSLSHDGSHLELSVADSHPHRPKALQTPYGIGGRGLHLVRALVKEAHGSHDVVREAATGGKRIEIRFPAPATEPCVNVSPVGGQR
ncbi:ATP-binding protein [Streptomyces sp. S1D4-11]|nr:ATP-binding protein [Streptomyces sp. S1D4-11]QIY94486.1 ATP-binding protein [Streptomyces sp. S1D4-11]